MPILIILTSNYLLIFETPFLSHVTERSMPPQFSTQRMSSSTAAEQQQNAQQQCSAAAAQQQSAAAAHLNEKLVQKLSEVEGMSSYNFQVIIGIKSSTKKLL